MDEGQRVILWELRMPLALMAVLAASIFHFGTFTIPQAKAHMAAAGIPMRLN